MNLTAGTRLGPYEIGALLGAGGMGEVYRARDPRLGRDVAIKVLPSAFSADPDRLHRFEQEARAAAALSHPNILAVHDIGQHDGSPYIVSELLEGVTLREHLRGGGASRATAAPAPEQSALPVRKAVDYANQIANGLAAAHEKGITHRDLKPENLFITRDGHVKILDFGLAHIGSRGRDGSGGAGGTDGSSGTDGAGLTALPTRAPDTLPGMVLGTVGYMSPEQVRGLSADYRSDIFAFGAILHEMLAGQRAFRGATPADTMTAILNEHPPDLPTAERRIPPALERIVDRCLEKSPAARFQSTGDLAFALEGLSGHSGTADAVDHGVSRRSRERLAWLVAAASLIAAIAGIAMALYVRPAAPEPVVTRLDVVTPPTTDPFSFALSPDGQQLAFVAIAENGPRLWVRPLDQVTARSLVGTEGASYPFWAPDSRALGFFADGKLKRIDLTGGAPQALADAPIGRGGAWNREGVIVFAPTSTSGLMRVTAAGGAPTALTRLAGGQGSHRWPQFLPDGRRFLFLVALGQPDVHGMYIGSLDAGEVTRVLVTETAAVYTPPGYLLLASQGGVLLGHRFDATRGVVSGDPIPLAQSVGANDGSFLSAFSVSGAAVLAHRTATPSRRQLVWVDRTGKALSVLAALDETAFANPELAPDGRRVAAARTIQGNNDIWLIDVTRGVASRFTSDAAVDNQPVWSPDGARIVFRSTRNGRGDLFERAADAAADEQPLLVTAQDKAPLDWSSDGRILLYATTDPKTGSDLWALPLVGERKPFPVAQTRFEEVQGQLSPDGRWMTYASNESGRNEIYARPFPGQGGKWQVSTGGGIQPRWRQDGQELYYVAPDGKLMAVGIQVAEQTHTLAPGAPVVLFPARLASGANAVVAGFSSRAQYVVARDRRFLLNMADEGVASPITIVQNWTTGLK